MSFWTPYWDTIDYMRNNMGASYDEIITITREVFEGKAVAKSTLSNRYGVGVSEKAYARNAKNRAADPIRAKIIRNLSAFSSKTTKTEKKESAIIDNAETETRGIDQAISRSISRRLKRFTTKGNEEAPLIKYTDFIEHVTTHQNYNHEERTLTDYLTGETLCLKTDEFNLDHIDNKGENTLANLGVTSKVLNRMKSDQSMEELLDNCIKLLRHNRPEVLIDSEK